MRAAFTCSVKTYRKGGGFKKGTQLKFIAYNYGHNRQHTHSLLSNPLFLLFVFRKIDNRILSRRAEIRAGTALYTFFRSEP